MAGNVDEWTMEAISISSRVVRGGNFYHYGANFPASNRISSYPEGSYGSSGFRLTLYIK